MSLTSTPKPGKLVPIGARMSPSGMQGLPGTFAGRGDQGADGTPGRASSVTVAGSFTVPAIGSTVQIEVEDASWVVAGQMIYVGQAGAGGEAGDFKVVSVSRPSPFDPWRLTLLNPPPGGAGPRGPAGFAFYGAAALVSDTGGMTRYAVTLGDDFSLEAGMQLFITIPQRNSFPPRLNVNGGGDLVLRTKTGVALSRAELAMNGAYGLFYDGSGWRIFTPLARSYSGVGGNTDVDCSGYDSVEVNVSVNAACGLALLRLGYGVPVTIKLSNATGVNHAYYVRATNPANEFGETRFTWANTLSGVNSTRIDNTNVQTLNANSNLLFIGSLTQLGNELALL